jgi:hypothetical protein
MKRVIIGLVIALASAQSANADGIRSPLGISQAEWNASETYKNFVCPQNTSRGEGVDMNFTTTQSDDFWFVNCNPIIQIAPRPVHVEQFPSPTLVVTPITTPTQTETTTATNPVESSTQPMIQTSTPTPTVAPKSVDTPTATVVDTETTIKKIETVTVKSILDEELDYTWEWEKIWEWIIAFLDRYWGKP